VEQERDIFSEVVYRKTGAKYQGSLELPYDNTWLDDAMLHYHAAYGPGESAIRYVASGSMPAQRRANLLVERDLVYPSR